MTDDPTSRPPEASGAQPQPAPTPAQQQVSPGVPLIVGGLIQQAHWQGPYPPPEAVERYEKVCPGAFDRMIGMAERLQKAQIDQSSEALKNQKDDRCRGHYLGFTTTVLAMGGAIGS